MSPIWDDEYLTVSEVAEHLKLNQQTIRNYIDQGSLPAVRIGRRVRVRRTDLDRILAQGMTVAPAPPSLPPPATPVDARALLAGGIERAHRLLGRRSAARRSELAEGLQDLTDTVAAVMVLLAEEPASGAEDQQEVDPERRGELAP
jgi:excisionase family DNA binding protein